MLCFRRFRGGPDVGDDGRGCSGGKHREYGERFGVGKKKSKKIVFLFSSVF